MGKKRISYRCLPEERRLSLEKKSRWNVYSDGEWVGHIVAENKRTGVDIRIWKPSVYEGSFNPFEFPHVNTEEEVHSLNEPCVVPNNDDDDDCQMELRMPSLMTINEARIWVRNIIKGEQ